MTCRSKRCLSLLLTPWLIGALAISAEGAPDAAALTPLAPEARAALDAIEPDPPPEQITRNIHYIVSDEVRHDLFRPHIENLGGVFLGVGSNQNYLLAAWAKPDILVLLDFDQMIPDLHRVYGVVFANAKDPEAFMQLWSREGSARLLELVKAAYPDNKALRRRVVQALRYSRWGVNRKLRDLNRLWTELGVRHYLNDQAQYDYLRRLFETDRVLFIRGDLTGDKAMAQLAKVMKRFGWPLRVYHPSNAEQYFKYTRQYRDNCLNMPTDERSIVVRTRAWREKVPEGEVGPGEGGKGKLWYTYAVQRYDNFRLWLARRRTTNVRSMLTWKTLRKDGLYLIDELPPEPKPRRRRRARRRSP